MRERPEGWGRAGRGAGRRPGGGGVRARTVPAAVRAGAARAMVARAVVAGAIAAGTVPVGMVVARAFVPALVTPAPVGPALLTLVAATLLALAPVAAPATAASYPNGHLLVETEALAGLLGAPGLRLVDLRADPEAGERQYRAGHLPGAVYLAWRELDDARANAEGYPIRPERAAALFGRLGIDHETTVVAYDDARGLLAARLFFVLEYYGHTKVRLLHGGLGKWRREGRPLTTEVPAVEPRTFAPRPRREVLATAGEVKAGLGKAEVCLIDARSPGEYAGTDVRARRGGRIPGARNVEWLATVRPAGTFHPAEELRALFEAAGVGPEREIITYCQTGVRAAHAYFALRLLGYARVRTYDGSWAEWGNDPALPLER